MRHADAATRWSLGLWAMFGLMPVVLSCLPWAVWTRDATLASWVQAVGSVFAVLATGAAILLQHALSQRQRRVEVAEAHARRIEGARRVMAAGVNVLAKCIEQFAAAGPTGVLPATITLMRAEMRTITTLLHSVDAIDTDCWELTEAIGTARSVSNAALEFLDRLASNTNAVELPNRFGLKAIFTTLHGDMVRVEAVLAQALGYPAPII